MKFNQINVLIPARMGSSRLANKIMLPLGGVPLVWKTFQAAMAFKSRIAELMPPIDVSVTIVVDSDETRDAISTCGVADIVVCPDASSGTERALAACDRDGPILVWQADWPLINVDDLITMINLATLDRADIWTMAIRVPNSDRIATNHNLVKVVTTDHNRVIYFSRSSVPFRSKHLKIHTGIYLICNVADVRTASDRKAEQFVLDEDLEQLKYLSNGLSMKCVSFDTGIFHGVDTRSEYEYYANLIDASSGDIIYGE